MSGVVVLYVGVNHNRCIMFGYRGSESKKPKNKPNYHIATETGFKYSQKAGAVKKIEVDEMILKSYPRDIPRLIDDILEILKTGVRVHIIYLTHYVQRLIYLFSSGETHNGLTYNEVGITNTKPYLDNKNVFKGLVLLKYIEYEGETFSRQLFNMLSKPIDIDLVEEGKTFFKKTKLLNKVFELNYLAIDTTNYKKDGFYRILNIGYPTDEEVGRPLNMTSERVIYLKDHKDSISDLLKGLIEKIVEVMGDDRNIVIIPIDPLTSLTAIKSLQYSDFRIDVTKTETKMVLKTIDDTIVANTVHPNALSNLVLKSCKYMDDFIPDDVIDITEYIYKDNKIISTIPMSKHLLNVPYKDTVLVLYLGIDMPTRNALKRIEKQVSKVLLKVLKEGSLYVYLVTIETKNGESYLVRSPTHSIGVN